MKFRKKIFLAGMSILLLLITTVSTTFAWFSLNNAAWVDEFEMQIQNSDKLLIRTENGKYQQMLTNYDIMNAINSTREEGEKGGSLQTIRLSEVSTFDGEEFRKLKFSYDSDNKQSITFEEADLNSYINFKVYFKIVEGNSTIEGEKPTYYLKLSDTDSKEGLKKTSITAEDQVIELLNDCRVKGVLRKKGYKVTVNPVNAIRLGIKGNPAGLNSSVDYIYEITDENDLGSYCCNGEALKAIGVGLEERYLFNNNTAMSYFESVHGYGLLSPLGYNPETFEVSEIEELKGLFKRLRYNFDDSLGTFKYNSETKSYNELSINIRIWLEGFDADNLIGLNANVIKCLLSFKLEEGGSDIA